MDADGSHTDRWVPALHRLYLATLLIAVLAVVTVDPVAAQWTTAQRNAAAVLAAAVLAAADLAMRRWRAFTDRPAIRIGYFLSLGVVVGILTTTPSSLFYTIGFGVLPSKPSGRRGVALSAGTPEARHWTHGTCSSRRSPASPANCTCAAWTGRRPPCRRSPATASATGPPSARPTCA